MSTREFIRNSVLDGIIQVASHEIIGYDTTLALDITCSKGGNPLAVGLQRIHPSIGGCGNSLGSAGAADVVGNYTWTYQTSTAYGDTATFTPGYGQVSLTQITGTQDSVIFNGFNLNNMNLKLHAVVNTEQGYVLIPDQIAYNHPTYGNIKAVALYNYNGSWYYEESIGMYINVDGSLTIPDYVFTIITSGAYSGSAYGNYYSSNNFSTMTDGNGIMIVTFNSTL